MNEPPVVSGHKTDNLDTQTNEVNITNENENKQSFDMTFSRCSMLSNVSKS